MRRWHLLLLTLLQAGCALFFVLDILLTLTGSRVAPSSWQWREALEIGAAIGLVLGTGLGFAALRHSMRAHARAAESLRIARSAFRDHVTQQFEVWGLTAAEKDVALFSLKGMSVAEIAALRATTEGTVKAQSNAIYRKAGVNGRAQLLSCFIEDMMLD
ncbi:hypothetical protein N6L24_10615 [Cognatishimia sp. SS12]|uniref:helix-turn-helix transcriptional regulator n=1 Tax=Cognatishimia sp. SS12 TaxID=2979465 RepID=UPI002330BF39|nr:hypothetical protein [Cognatishimia sp. SS12]MDC0738733.1 hypothetical protein [Cognatishimia sp. SS12]